MILVSVLEQSTKALDFLKKVLDFFFFCDVMKKISDLRAFVYLGIFRSRI